MIQKEFANSVVTCIKSDKQVIGLAAGGSWIYNELDAFSDLDLIFITSEKISDDKTKMMAYASRFGELISAFTGEHVGEARVLICLYDNPLLHVDIKFLTLTEFYDRVENPVILFERDGQLSKVINETEANWPIIDFQWIEDRFWTWIHYACLKIGRGELLEAVDFLAYLRTNVLSPLLQIKNKQLPRGLRKVEMNLAKEDLKILTNTIADYTKESVITSLLQAINLYKQTRANIFPTYIVLQKTVEEKVMQYLENIVRQQ